jgi:hypothetical protein
MLGKLLILISVVQLQVSVSEQYIIIMWIVSESVICSITTPVLYPASLKLIEASVSWIH